MNVLPYMDFLPHAIGLEHFMSLIRTQRNLEIVLGLESVLRFDRVRRYAEHGRVGLGKNCAELRKSNGFPGAAGGIGPRIEKKHEFTAAEVGQRDLAAAIGREF